MVSKQLNVTCRCPSFEKCRTEKCLYQLIVPFSKIAKDLFDRYKQAKLVTAEIFISKDGKVRRIVKIKNNGDRSRKAEVGDMVYLHRSRDFCLPDVHNPYKYPGTKGRECAMKLRSNIKNLAEYNPTLSLRFNVCADLCCGRRFFKKTVIKQVTCSCRFSKTRMDVVCKVCPVVAAYHICN